MKPSHDVGVVGDLGASDVNPSAWVPRLVFEHACLCLCTCSPVLLPSACATAAPSLSNRQPDTSLAGVRTCHGCRHIADRLPCTPFACADCDVVLIMLGRLWCSTSWILLPDPVLMLHPILVSNIFRLAPGGKRVGGSCQTTLVSVE